MAALVVAIAIAITVPLAACADGTGPLIIDRARTYVLDADRSGGGHVLIAVTTDNVVLDLNHKTIRCTPAAPGHAETIGIVAEYRRGVTVRNGSITGCKFGVSGAYGSGIVIDDVDFTGNTYIGANLGFGSGNVVRNSTFAAIRGYAAEAYAIGINGIGAAGLIEHNTFEDLMRPSSAGAKGEGVGVLVEAGATDVIIRNNTFANPKAAEGTIGTWFAEGASGVVVGNRYTNWHYAVQGAGPVVALSNDFDTNGAPRRAPGAPSSGAFSVHRGIAVGNTFGGFPAAFVPESTTSEDTDVNMQDRQ